jgi:hypothetical protein
MAVSLVQSDIDNSGGVASGSTVVVTLTSDTSLGNSIVLVTAQFDAVSAVSAVDSRGNTYSLRETSAGTGGANNPGQSIFVAPITTRLLTNDTITVTFSGATGGAKERVFVSEWAGLQTSPSPGDVQGSTTGSSTLPESPVVGPIALSNELMVALAVFPSTSFAPDPGWTIFSTRGVTNGSKLVNVISMYQIAPLVGSYSGGGATSLSVAWTGAIATFKPGPVSGTSSSKDLFQSVGPGLPEICVEVDVTNAPTNVSRVWTDLTLLTRRVSYTRSGRTNELNTTQTGTLDLLLSNRSNAVTALGLQKRMWVRLRARWKGTIYSLWQGVIEQAVRRWPAFGTDATIEITAADALKVLRLTPLDGQTFAQQRNDQRIFSILIIANLASGNLDTDTDTADAISTPFPANSDALTQATSIETSENGLLIARGDGKIDFQGRHFRYVSSALPLAALGENDNEIPYKDDAAYSDDDYLLANIVTVTPPTGSPATAQDAASIAARWPSSMQRSLNSSTPGLALSAAQYLVNAYSNPAARIPQLTIDLAAMPRTPNLVGVLLGAKNSDRFTWKRRQQATVGGAVYQTISQDVFVEQIGATIAPGSWTTTLELSPVTTLGGWVLDDPVNSILDSTTILVY